MLKDKARITLVLAHKEHLRLLTKPFVWAIGKNCWEETWGRPKGIWIRWCWKKIAQY